MGNPKHFRMGPWAYRCSALVEVGFFWKPAHEIKVYLGSKEKYLVWAWLNLAAFNFKQKYFFFKQIWQKSENNPLWNISHMFKNNKSFMFKISKLSVAVLFIFCEAEALNLFTSQQIWKSKRFKFKKISKYDRKSLKRSSCRISLEWVFNVSKTKIWQRNSQTMSNILLYSKNIFAGTYVDRSVVISVVESVVRSVSVVISVV